MYDYLNTTYTIILSKLAIQIEDEGLTLYEIRNKENKLRQVPYLASISEPVHRVLRPSEGSQIKHRSYLIEPFDLKVFPNQLGIHVQTT